MSLDVRTFGAFVEVGPESWLIKTLLIPWANVPAALWHGPLESPRT